MQIFITLLQQQLSWLWHKTGSGSPTTADFIWWVGGRKGSGRKNSCYKTRPAALPPRVPVGRFCPMCAVLLPIIVQCVNNGGAAGWKGCVEGVLEVRLSNPCKHRKTDVLNCMIDWICYCFRCFHCRIVSLGWQSGISILCSVEVVTRCPYTPIPTSFSLSRQKTVLTIRILYRSFGSSQAFTSVDLSMITSRFRSF